MQLAVIDDHSKHLKSDIIRTLHNWENKKLLCHFVDWNRLELIDKYPDNEDFKALD